MIALLSPFKKWMLFMSLLVSVAMNAQVGINTTSPNSNAMLDISSSTKGVLMPRVNLINTSIASPLGNHVAGMLVYNLATSGDVTPGYYYNNGTAWVRMSGSTYTEPVIDAISLTSDFTFTPSTTSTYTDINGMNLTFTARKTSVLVSLTASGYGTVNSMSIAFLRVFNSTSGNSIGGTMEKVQSFYDPSGPVEAWVTTWSASFSKLLTGLTIGNSYTIKVQGYVSPVTTGGSAVINPSSNPDSNHMTLSVSQ